MQESLVALFYGELQQNGIAKALEICNRMESLQYPSTITESLKLQLKEAIKNNNNVSQTILNSDNAANLGFQNYEPSLLRLFGKAILGPCLSVFYKRMISTFALMKSKPKVFFLAREGYLLKKGFELLTERLGIELESEYLVTSRTLIFRNLIDVKDSYPLIFDHAFEGKLSDLLRSRCGLMNDEINQVVISNSFRGGLDASVSTKSDSSSIQTLLLDNIDLFSHIASETRSVYNDYLDSIGFSGRDGLHVVDIGYSGTIQKGLSQLRNLPIFGHYLITTSKAKDNRMNKFIGYLYNRQQWGQGSPILEHSLFLEAIMTAPTGSAINISRGASGFTFTYGKVTSSQIGFKQIEHIFNGAIDYCLKALEFDFKTTPAEASHLYHMMVSSKYHFPLSALNVMEIDDEFSGLGVVKPIELYHY